MPLCPTQARTVREVETVKIKQLREMSMEELQENLSDLERRLFDLRSQAVTEKLENSNAISNTRRDVARIKTLLRERSE